MDNIVGKIIVELPIVMWYNNNDKFLIKSKILEEIRYENLLAVFSGHQHWTKKIVKNEITYYVVGSMTENINNDGIPDGVYFIVDFDEKKLNVIEKHIRL